MSKLINPVGLHGRLCCEKSRNGENWMIGSFVNVMLFLGQEKGNRPIIEIVHGS